MITGMRKLEAKQITEREDVVGIAAAIGVVPTRRDLALVVEQRIQYMRRFTVAATSFV
jgi:hypothetical protein